MKYTYFTIQGGIPSEHVLFIRNMKEKESELLKELKELNNVLNELSDVLDNVVYNQLFGK